MRTVALLALTALIASTSAADRTAPVREADDLLFSDPEKAISLCREALAEADGDGTIAWRGREWKVDDLRAEIAALTAAYQATASRSALAAFCADSLIGPDRLNASLQVARREVRQGSIEAAFKRAEAEELTGERRILLLATAVDHFQRKGDIAQTRAMVELMYQYFGTFDLWRRRYALEMVSDSLVAAEMWPDLVGLAHEMSGWRSPFFLSRATGLFPPETVATVRGQAIGIAQQQQPGEKALALTKIAAVTAAEGEDERVDRLAAAAEAAAKEAPPREKALALGRLAQLAGQRQKEEESDGYAAAAVETVMAELEGWAQTDALVELAADLAGSAAAPSGFARLEEAALSLVAAAPDDGSRNKHRLYEVLAVTAAVSPVDEYTGDKRLALFRQLQRLRAMPDQQEDAS